MFDCVLTGNFSVISLKFFEFDQIALLTHKNVTRHRDDKGPITEPNGVRGGNFFISNLIKGFQSNQGSSNAEERIRISALGL